MRFIWSSSERVDTRLVSYIQIKPAVAVIIGPRGRMGWVKREKSGGLGCVGKLASSIVLQKRVGMESGLIKPRSTKDQKVAISVVVVVCVGKI